MLAGGGLIKLAHLEVPVLHLNPPEAVLDFHLNSPILNLLHLPVLLPIFLNYLHCIGYFFL